MRRKPTLAFAVVPATAALLLAGPLLAQSTVEDAIRQFTGPNGKGYTQPLADLFAADMNSGFYHTAMIPRSGLRFSLELVAMGSALEESHRTFTAMAPEGYTPATFTTATVFGGAGTTISSGNGTSYRGSDGFIDADYLPAAVPQIRLGGIAGTELVARYFSSSIFSFLEDSEFPETTLMGIGLRHSISQYLDDFPVDLAVGGLYGTVEMGDILDYSGLTFGVQASRDFSLFTLYGGVSSESGSMTLTYVSTDQSEPDPISIDLDAEGGVRFSAGLGLNLGFLKLFGGASIGSVTTYSGGIRFGS